MMRVCETLSHCETLSPTMCVCVCVCVGERLSHTYNIGVLARGSRMCKVMIMLLLMLMLMMVMLMMAPHFPQLRNAPRHSLPQPWAAVSALSVEGLTLYPGL